MFKLTGGRKILLAFFLGWGVMAVLAWFQPIWLAYLIVAGLVGALVVVFGLFWKALGLEDKEGRP